MTRGTAAGVCGLLWLVADAALAGETVFLLSGDAALLLVEDATAPLLAGDVAALLLAGDGDFLFDGDAALLVPGAVAGDAACATQAADLQKGLAGDAAIPITAKSPGTRRVPAAGARHIRGQPTHNLVEHTAPKSPHS